MKRALRQHATTLILVILAAAAAVVVLVMDRGAVTTDEVERRKQNLLEVWRPDEITEVSLTTQGRTAILRRGDPDDAGQRLWRVEIDGQQYAADEQAVDQLLGTLEFATPERRVSAEAENAAALGLDAPKIAIALTMGPRRERIVVGGSAPTPAGAMYAEVAGRGTFVITKHLAAALDVPVDRLRSRTFVPYLSTELSGLHLEGEGGARRFTRAAWGGSRGGGFRFDGSTTDGSSRAQADAIDRVLVALGQMQADVFLSDEEAAAASKPEVTLTMLPRDPAAKRAVIEVGGACPRGDGGTGDEDGGEGQPRRVVAVRREPTRAAACVPASVLDALRAPAADFVDLAPIAAPVDEIAELKLTGERTLDLAREGSGWHLRAPEDRKVDPEAGRDLVEALTDVRAARIVPAGEARGLDPPRATLRVLSTPPGAGGTEPGERIETLEIGALQGDVVHVRRAEDGMVLEVPRDQADALLPSEVGLRPRRLFDFRVVQARTLRIEAGGRVQRLRRTPSGAWELLEPTGDGLRADLGLTSDVVDLLSGLEARRWVSPDAGDGYGLGKPRIVISLEYEAQEPDGGATATREARVEIGAPTAGGSFARAGGDHAVFIAPQRLEAAASRLLLSRAVFQPPVDRITRVTLTPERGAPVVVTPGQGGWRVTEGASDEATSAALAAGVRDALDGLLAEEAVSLGPPRPDQGLERPRLRVAIELAPPGPGDADAPAEPIRFALGAGDALRGTSVVYARREGVAATYAIPQSRVRPLLEAAGIR